MKSVIDGKLLFKLFIINFVILYFGLTCFAKNNKPRLGQFRVSISEQGFIVSAKLHRAFNREVEERIQAGIPVTFLYQLKLKQIRWYWDNKVMKEVTYSHTVTFDTLKKVYTIVIKESDNSKNIKVLRTDDFIEMKKIMCHFEGILNFKRSKLKKERKYYLSLEASLKSNKLPRPWNSILFFINQGFKTQTARYFFSSDHL